jgi:hypothetical protein
VAARRFVSCFHFVMDRRHRADSQSAVCSGVGNARVITGVDCFERSIQMIKELTTRQVHRRVQNSLLLVFRLSKIKPDYSL